MSSFQTKLKWDLWTIERAQRHMEALCKEIRGGRVAAEHLDRTGKRS